MNKYEGIKKVDTIVSQNFVRKKVRNSKKTRSTYLKWLTVRTFFSAFIILVLFVYSKIPYPLKTIEKIKDASKTQSQAVTIVIDAAMEIFNDD